MARESKAQIHMVYYIKSGDILRKNLSGVKFVNIFAKVSYRRAISRLRAFIYFCAPANIGGEYNSNIFNGFP